MLYRGKIYKNQAFRKESSEKKKRIKPAKRKDGFARRIIDVRWEERKIFYLSFFYEPKEFKSDFKS